MEESPERLVSKVSRIRNHSGVNRLIQAEERYCARNTDDRDNSVLE